MLFRPFYLSIPPTVSARHWAAVKRRMIGVITTPRVRTARIPQWPVWAADNACFSNESAFDLDAYLAWLERWGEHAPRCLFATAPDVLCDARATWERSEPVLPRIRALGYPAALVAQNGFDVAAVNWNAIDVLFIGGDDKWKEGPEAARALAHAQALGKRTHIGRVNTKARLHLAIARNVDTVDGTHLAFGPDKKLDSIFAWYGPWRRRPRGMKETA